MGLLDVFVLGLGIWLLLQHETTVRLLAHTPATLPFLAYLVVAAASLGTAAEAGVFINEMVKVLQAFVLYIGFALIFCRQPADVYAKSFWIWTFTFLLVVIIAAVWHVIFARSTPVPNPITDPQTARRYFRFGWGTFAFSNYFAGMLLAFIPALWYRLSGWRAVTPPRPLVASGLLLVFGMALILTFSRGALLALTIGLVLMALDRAPGRKYRILLLGVAGSLVAWFAIAVPVGRRLFDFAGRSLAEVSNDRLFVWQEAIRTIQDHPWLGVGLGNYGAQLTEQPWAHNMILQVSVETGIVGLLAYLSFLGAVGWMLVRVRNKTREASDWWVFHGALAAFVIMLAHNLVENTLIGVLYAFLFWPLQALVLARYWREEGIYE